VLVRAIECKECDTIVYSRTERDARECCCGRVMVSGGRKHFKYSAAIKTQYEVKKIDISPLTPSLLYEDWYQMDDEFGLITTSEPTRGQKDVFVL